MILSTAGKAWQFQAISSESEQIVSKSRSRVTGWQSRESWSANEPERGRRAARPSADPPRVPRCLHATVVSAFQSCGTTLWASALLLGLLIGQTRGHGFFSSPAPGSIEFGGSRGTRGRQGRQGKATIVHRDQSSRTPYLLAAAEVSRRPACP